MEEFLELGFVEGVRWSVDGSGSGGAGFQDCSFERGYLVHVVEEMVSYLSFY